MDNPFMCPICLSKACVPPAGNTNSKVAIIGEFPGDEEIKKGRPMVGNAGKVLRAELGRCGIDLSRIRVGNLWLHAKNGSENCLNYGAQQIITDSINREVILLMGSDAVMYFTDKKVSDVSSLIVKSKYFSCIVFASINPAQAFHQGLGELRLAITKFSDYIYKKGLLT